MPPAQQPEPTVRITRRFSFAASVRLFDPGLGEVENERLYGRAARLHGHNYVLDVTVAGAVDPTSGMIMNLQDLKALVGAHLDAHYDHRHLNTDVPGLRGSVPTPERIAQALWTELGAMLPTGVALHRLRLWAGEETFVEVAA